jgi:hypothetical protein
VTVVKWDDGYVMACYYVFKLDDIFHDDAIVLDDECAQDVAQ